ncbi:hypothetical protein CROQUDRAFT_92509 [Cronartium quercuum f. sp. fusiforme G11]|uniref:Uncharacterized protein n=1 Tax=Cronartium quercuum f. sp. fusiforme G11 TaxID=708437 RepID=A0A9P6TCA5_9BASI|nr:hypothetical protein CROQUDRAFT_92509 [Cronartium quercuum f. sp. fusiforme G11]
MNQAFRVSSIHEQQPDQPDSDAYLEGIHQPANDELDNDLLDLPPDPSIDLLV